MANFNLSPEQFRETLDLISSGAGFKRGDGESVLATFVRQANQNLLNNPNYTANLSKMLAARSQLANNSQAVQANINQLDQQVLDATEASRQKVQQSGLTNSGLAIRNAVNTSEANRNTLTQLQQATRSNRETLESINLYNEANRAALLTNIHNLLGNIPSENSGWKRFYAGNGKKGAYWRNERTGQTIASEDIDKAYGNVNDILNPNYQGTTPPGKPDFGPGYD